MGLKIQLALAIVSLPLLLYLWPSSLGGDTEFVDVNGNSMLPTFTSGTLAIVKKSPSFEVGDIAVYDSDALGKVVIHRIIEQKDDGFIFKGDNNLKVDPGTITQDKIHGKVVFATPYIGVLPNLLKEPMILGIVLLAAVSLGFKKKKNTEIKKKNVGRSYFPAAILTNLACYVVAQISIAIGITPHMDGLTNYLVNSLNPFIGSTMAFAIWFFAIIGIYLVARYSKLHPPKKLENISSNGVLQVKEQNSMLLACEAFYMLLTMIQVISLTVAVKGLFTSS